MRTSHFRILGVSTLVLFTVAGVGRPLEALPTLETPCHVTTLRSFNETLPLNETISWEGIEDRAYFVLKTPSPGWLALEIAVPGRDLAFPWIELTSGDCAGAGADAGIFVVEHSPRRQLFALAAGTYSVRVKGVSVGLPLPPFRLSTRFLELSADDTRPWDLSPKDGEDDGDLTEEAYNEILPLWLDPSGVGAFCTGGEPADDLSFCARPLEVGDVREETFQDRPFVDQDYFTFTLERADLLRIFTTGPADTAGVLYNEYGQELTMAEDGGPGENFALLARLGRGSYYVRVEGSPEIMGGYRMHLVGSAEESAETVLLGH